MKKQRTHFCFSQVTSLALAASLSISAASGMTALAAEPVEVVPVEAVEAVEVLPEAVIEAEEEVVTAEVSEAVGNPLKAEWTKDQVYTLADPVPWNLSELKQVVDVKDPRSVAAYWVWAVTRMTDNYNDGMEMMKYLFADIEVYGSGYYPGGLSGKAGWDTYLNDRLKSSEWRWHPRAYFEGATKDNGLKPSRPFQIELYYNEPSTMNYNEQSYDALGRLNIVYWVKSYAGGNQVTLPIFKPEGSDRWYVMTAAASGGLFFDQRGALTTAQKNKAASTNNEDSTQAEHNAKYGGGSDDPTPVIETGWIKGNNGYMYVRADGSMPKNKWEKIGGVYYHFDADGYMQTGWFKEGKKWYYLKSSGAMATGWLKISGKYYYFNSSGVMQSNAWVKSGGKWYYMDGSGVMVAGTSKKIGKKTYRFNASGVCLNP